MVTEGVYSMDGDSAPLGEMQQVTQQHNGWLMVDDAHGTGVIRRRGRGDCWLQKVETRIAGSDFWQRIWRRGAAVLCSSTVATISLQFAAILSTAPVCRRSAQALHPSLAVIRSDEGDPRREKLAALVSVFVPEYGFAGLHFC
ncbi:aminotransferase class I/II-fold pyridoxal phosphate-dependent enzyme [Shigella boydii]